MDLTPVRSSLTYDTFLEEAYGAIREQAPSPGALHLLQPWVRGIGEILFRMPHDLQQYWTEQYATLIMVKYGHIRRDMALVCVRQGLTEAEDHWPTEGRR